jgi:Sugar (and other) transporter
VYAGLGMSGPNILLITGIDGTLSVIITGLFITFILDRVGRKKPLIFGGIGMALCLAFEAAINAKWGGKDAHNPTAQQAGIAFIIVCHTPIAIYIGLTPIFVDIRFSFQRQFRTSILGISK